MTDRPGTMRVRSDSSHGDATSVEHLEADGSYTQLIGVTAVDIYLEVGAINRVSMVFNPEYLDLQVEPGSVVFDCPACNHTHYVRCAHDQKEETNESDHSE